MHDFCFAPLIRLTGPIFNNVVVRANQINAMKNECRVGERLTEALTERKTDKREKERKEEGGGERSKFLVSSRIWI